MGHDRGSYDNLAACCLRGVLAMTISPYEAAERAVSDIFAQAKEIGYAPESLSPKLAKAAIDAFLSKSLEGADGRVVEARTRSIQLRQMAKSASEASKILAADKQARNRAAGDETATYNGLEAHETREWRSAEAIDELLALITALTVRFREQKAAHAKMLRDEADMLYEANKAYSDHGRRQGVIKALWLRELADKIEGEP